MSRVLKGSGVLVGCMALLCICVFLISMQVCARSIVFVGNPDDGGYDPPGATCANAGQSYPGNPFHGWPQEGRGWGDINYYYCAEDYQQEFGRTHWGIDIDAYHREPVYATAAAIVAWAYEDTQYGRGRTVKICTEGWCATYMHLDEWLVSAGQPVTDRQLLGYSDNTGFSTGTHLHYQLNHPDGFPVDPAPTMGATRLTLETLP